MERTGRLRVWPVFRKGFVWFATGGSEKGAPSSTPIVGPSFTYRRWSYSGEQLPAAINWADGAVRSRKLRGFYRI
jgi:hypothetical protein